MSSLAILVPVKSASVKSRLSSVLSARARVEFSKLLLEDVLRVLSGAGLIDVTHVVTPDRETLRLAGGFGARGVAEEKDQGVNAAVQRGIKEAGHPERVLVIPSDLPLLQVSDMKEVLRLISVGLDVVITPSQGFDGTNALAFSPDSGLMLSYDQNSFWNHLASAARKNLTTAVSCRRGLMFDVDSPQDFRMLARTNMTRPSVRFARRNSP
jgi:2-phospho-L-lactate guanylyltransferase